MTRTPMRSDRSKPAASEAAETVRRPRRLHALSAMAAGGVLGLAAFGTGLAPSADLRALLAGTAAHAQDAETGSSEPQAADLSDDAVEAAGTGTNEAAAASREGDASGVAPFVDHARQAGTEVCAGLLPTLGDMLTRGSSYTVQTNWTEGAGDDGPVQSLVGMRYDTEGFSGAAAGFVLADPGPDSCAGAMVRVVPFPDRCEAVVDLLPAGSTPLEDLSDVRAYALGDGGRSLMIPGEASCVVVSIATATSVAPAE